MTEINEVFVATEPNDGSRWVSEEDYIKLKDERDKFMWQVRDTCARAEKAEGRIVPLKARLDELVRLDDEDKRSIKDPEDRAYHAGRAAGLRLAIGYLADT